MYYIVFCAEELSEAENLAFGADNVRIQEPMLTSGKELLNN